MHRLQRLALTVVVWAACLWSAQASDRDLRLIDAARSRDARLVATLIKQGVNVNVAQPDGATALHWAAQWDDLETASLLLHAGALPRIVNDYGVSPLWYACLNGSTQRVEALVKGGGDANMALPTGETALMTASRTGKVAPVQALLAKGASVNAHERLKGQTALMWAVSEGHRDVAKVLLEA